MIGVARDGLRDRRRPGGGSDKRGYVNRDPLPARSPGAGWGYFLAAFFLRSAQ